ncbi:sigma-70 family RNA polymerase sigma factor [soil metagenome]
MTNCQSLHLSFGFGNYPVARTSYAIGTVNSDDRRLIGETLSGHTAAFGELVVRYQDRLFNAVLRVVDHPEDAADVVQDSFVNAYQSLASFKGDAEFFTWLYRIAFNAAISWRRRKRNTVSLNAAVRGNPIPEPSDDALDARPGEAMERSEDEASLEEAMRKLSPEHRQVLVLKDLESRKYEEIAEILEVPIGTVRSRLHRARLELRDILVSNDTDALTTHPVEHADAE